MKQQLLLAGGGILILASLLFFGTNVTKKTALPSTPHSTLAFDIKNYLHSAKQNLPVYQLN